MLHGILAPRPMLRHKLCNSLRKLAESRGHEDVTVGSICTGFGVAEMCVDALNDSLNALVYDGKHVPKASLFGRVLILYLTAEAWRAPFWPRVHAVFCKTISSCI